MTLVFKSASNVRIHSHSSRRRTAFRMAGWMWRMKGTWSTTVICRSPGEWCVSSKWATIEHEDWSAGGRARLHALMYVGSRSFAEWHSPTPCLLHLVHLMTYTTSKLSQVRLPSMGCDVPMEDEMISLHGRDMKWDKVQSGLVHGSQPGVPLGFWSMEDLQRRASRLAL